MWGNGNLLDFVGKWLGHVFENFQDVLGFCLEAQMENVWIFCFYNCFCCFLQQLKHFGCVWKTFGFVLENVDFVLQFWKHLEN